MTNAYLFEQHLPILLVFAATLITAAIFHVVTLYQRRNRKRTSITQEFLRSPGQSLLKEIGHLNDHIQILVCYLSILPFVIYTSLLSAIHFGGRNWNPIDMILVICIGLTLMVWLTIKLIREIELRKNIRICYEGKLTTGQELNQLMIHGCHVYHDFHAENFNIDHIVAGPKGVFAVETMAHAASATDHVRKDATVEYNGHALYFPDITDLETIGLAQEKADWISKWLSSATGEPLASRAIVSIPGWYIKRTSAEGISVVNPRQFDSLFEHIKSRDLDESILNQIVDHLERKSRDFN